MMQHRFKADTDLWGILGTLVSQANTACDAVNTPLTLNKPLYMHLTYLARTSLLLAKPVFLIISIAKHSHNLPKNTGGEGWCFTF